MGNTMAELFFPTAVLFIAAQLIDPAVQAQSIMTAYNIAAFRAAPLCFFFL
jgi:hypothetical protein